MQIREVYGLLETEDGPWRPSSLMRRKRVGSSSRDQNDEAKSNHTTLVRWC